MSRFYHVASLEPGDTITALEGVDLSGEKAVVVSLVENGDETTTVTLLFPDLKASKTFKVPSDSIGSVRSEAPTKQVPLDVVDTLRLGPNRTVPSIRDNVPDTFFPPDPNGTQPTMTDVLWRPTVRRTPFTRGIQARSRRRGAAEEQGYSTFPATMPKSMDEHRPPSSTRIEDGWSDGSPRRPRQYNRPYEVRIDRSQHPVVDPDRSLTPEDGWTNEAGLEKLAEVFWNGYQETRYTKLPGRPGLGHTGLNLEVWAILFQEEGGLSTTEMEELWQYMVATRRATATAYRNWKDMLRQNMLNPVRTPLREAVEPSRVASVRRTAGYKVRYVNIDDEHDVTDYEAWGGEDTDEALLDHLGEMISWTEFLDYPDNAEVVSILEQDGDHVTFGVEPQAKFKQASVRERRFAANDDLIERYLGTESPSAFESIEEIEDYFSLASLRRMFGPADYADAADAKQAVIEAWQDYMPVLEVDTPVRVRKEHTNA